MGRNSTFTRNPYITGRPIDETETQLFFGREDIFIFIKDKLTDGEKFIFLSGQRRIGKSSVIFQISRYISQDTYTIVKFDLQDQANISLENILYDLANKIIESINLSSESEIENLPSITETELKQDPDIFCDIFLPRIYQNLGNKKLVLLLDEFDALIPEKQGSTVHSFVTYLQTIYQKDKNNKLFFILVVMKSLNNMPNILTLLRKSPSREIGLLDKQITRDMITKPANEVLTYKSEAIEEIFKMSAGHPNFTQIICYEIFMQARIEQRWEVGKSHVIDIIKSAMKSAEGQLLSLLESLSIHEQIVFSAVAYSEYGININELLQLLPSYGFKPNNSEEEELIKAKNELIERGFLEKKQTINIYNDIYKVKIQFVNLWLKEKNKLEEVIIKFKEIKTSQIQANTSVSENQFIGRQEKFQENYSQQEQESNSPYSVGIPVKPNKFIGRKREIEDASTRIRQYTNTVFYGSIGIGKTSFLKYLKSGHWISRNETNKYMIVYLDCNLIDDFVEKFAFSSFWKNVLNELNYLVLNINNNYQDNEPSNIEGINSLQLIIDRVLHEPNISKDNVKEILQRIKDNGNQLVLLLDNYDAIFKQKNDNDEILFFLKSFVSLTQNDVPGCVATIQTSSNSLTELTQYQEMRDYLSDFSIPFQTFQVEEIKYLWDQMPNLWKRKITIENLKEFTGGYPAIIQIFCYILYRELFNKQTVSNETLRILERDFHVVARVIFNKIWISLNDSEKMLLMLIALENVKGRINDHNYYVQDIDKLLTDSRYKNKLDEMQMRGILLYSTVKNQSQQPKKEKYSFAASAMQEWIIREKISSNSEPEVKEREIVLFRITKGQVNIPINNTQKAIQWIGKNSENFQNLAGGISNILRLFIL